MDIWILGFGPRFVLKACQLVIFLKYSEIIKKNRRTLIRLLQNQKINHPDYNLKEKLCQPHYYYKYLYSLYNSMAVIRLEIQFQTRARVREPPALGYIASKRIYLCKCM